jgi:hypothetical protein
MSSYRSQVLSHKYYFHQYGFEIRRTPAEKGIRMKLVFEDTRDSLNNRHSYEILVTDELLDSQHFTVDRFMELFEQTYLEDNNCAFDYFEEKNPDRFILNLYEQETGNTLVSLEFKSKNYA